MSVGKIAAQTGHAILGNYQLLQKSQYEMQLLNQWKQKGSQKAAFKVNSKEQMLSIQQKASSQGISTYIVCDAGKTQIEPGSITVCAIGPLKSENVDKIVEGLQHF
ncbi:hypothetical protein IMG5_159690 [Ichthyophthirius multifiliis]|uniref:peptidyl-tRNA hydrolase n=1 Tax=Ichthyophthirius multifiliis TaxID=5932 RepID=G0QZT7_ICHMU|nr:hypothetical protein IMG5_159690 [Ichthyophthirius multifiliis]EGR29275.1 hypothetical protein IMG5_159690 [Ichthyophthirius multifiliis]|eukprot:XP_004030511.1 hypothetical protein IMG5_159690 [Ichthyophthirius multifiliis]